MPKLTDTQLVILSAAAKRDDHAVFPLPKSLKCNKGAASIVLKSLLGRGLLAECPAGPGEPAWREAEDGQRFGLVLAESGLQTLGIEHPAARPARREAAPRPAPAPAEGARPGTKLAALVDLLKRKDGATIPDIVAATGWQSHSVRGAISGALKRKMGLRIESQAEEGRGRVYRIAGASQ